MDDELWITFTEYPSYEINPRTQAVRPKSKRGQRLTALRQAAMTTGQRASIGGVAFHRRKGYGKPCDRKEA